MSDQSAQVSKRKRELRDDIRDLLRMGRIDMSPALKPFWNKLATSSYTVAKLEEIRDDLLKKINVLRGLADIADEISEGRLDILRHIAKPQ